MSKHTVQISEIERRGLEAYLFDSKRAWQRLEAAARDLQIVQHASREAHRAYVEHLRACAAAHGQEVPAGASELRLAEDDKGDTTLCEIVWEIEEPAEEPAGVTDG